MIKDVKAYVGMPGTGKTYRLCKIAIENIRKEETNYIMSPTRSAKANIISQFREFLDAREITKEEFRILRNSVNVLHGYDELLEINHILIEEASQIERTNLYGLVLQTMDMENVDLTMFFDILQLKPIYGISIAQDLLSFNQEKDVEMGFWKWVNNFAYDSFDDVALLAIPPKWHINSKVEIHVERTNHRLLKASGFDSYDEDYMEYLFNNTVTKLDYSEYLFNAIKNNTLIITPTNPRGTEVDEMLDSHLDSLGINRTEAFPFIEVGQNYYLNPNQRISRNIAKAFDFLDYPSDGLDYNPLDMNIYKSYIVTHRTQGVTVDNSIVYMGNKPIGKKYEQHYNKNLLYVSVSRSRNTATLLGDEQMFRKMQLIYPADPQNQMGGFKKKEALKLTIRKIREEKILKHDYVYETYLRFMEQDILSERVTLLLKEYEVNNEIYPKRYVIEQVNKKVSTDGTFSDLRKWLSENKVQPKNNLAIKSWIESLEEKETEDLKFDLKNLTHRAFKEKYKKDKRTKAFNILL